MPSKSFCHNYKLIVLMKVMHEIQLLQSKIAISGDAIAFEQLYVSLFQPLRFFAFTIIHCNGQAEEIVEEAFVQLWLQKEILLDIQNFKVYIYVSVRNIANMYLKKENMQSHNSIDHVDVNSVGMDSNREQLFINTELCKRINTAVHNLPPKYKLIYIMVKEDVLSYKDIATILNITVKTIDYQLAIALKKISLAINFDLKKKLTVEAYLNNM